MGYVEGQHPRDNKGRWKRKGSSSGSSGSGSGKELAIPGSKELAVSGSKSAKSGKGAKLPGTGRVTLRAGLSSVTVGYGRTVPVIPGKVRLHVGVFARLEKDSSGPNFLEKRFDKALDKIATKLPKGKVGEAVGDVLKGKKTDIGGVTVGTGKRRRVNPQIRVASKKASTAGRKVRQPRQPRQRRAK
jgi:hypothetical protein